MILKRGKIVDPVNNVNDELDIEFENGKVVNIGKNLSGSEEFDATGLWVFPGVIDSHLHIYNSDTTCVFSKVVETGVTTAIDFAGPVRKIAEEINEYGYGLNVGCVEAISRNDSSTYSYDITRPDINRYLERILSEGALGPKLLCGHYPITPRAIADVIEEANKRKIIATYHAGSTENGSDLNGMKEAIELCGDNKMILAHINAYLRGKTGDVQDEIKEAFSLLRKHENIFSDCHLAVMNGCFGKCIDGIPEDNIVKNCLGMYGLSINQEGIIKGIKTGIIKVIYITETDVGLLEGREALNYFLENDTDAKLSFAVNIPYVAAACFTEKRTPNGDYLIEMTGTDGGYIPRNNLLNRVLHYYALGYISLEDAVRKMSSNAAEIFGLKNKGHLGMGADADITIVNPQTLNAEYSFIGGELAMKKGIAVKRPGKMLTTEKGEKFLKEKNVAYEIVNTEESKLYKKGMGRI